MRGETVIVPTEGSSMWPFIRNGDQVKLELAGRVRRGDVVLAAHGDRWLLHRVVGFATDGPILRGDNAPDERTPVRWGQVLGQATEVCREGQWRPLAPAMAAFLHTATFHRSKRYRKRLMESRLFQLLHPRG